MSNERIRELLAELRQEIGQSELDDETSQLLSSLDSSVNQLPTAPGETSDTEALIEQARMLEAKFASEHPAAEQFVRYMVDTLARMGI